MGAWRQVNLLFGGGGRWSSMIDPDTFAALRLETFFPEECPRGRKTYLFDAEYWEGLWHQDQVPGVQMLFPEADRRKLGALMLSHPFEDSSAPRPVVCPDPAEMRRNALKLTGVLDLPFRFGDGQAKVKALAEGRKIKTYRIRETRATQLSFQCGKPAVFRLLGLFGHKEGLCELEIARLDLVRANRKYPGAASRKRS